jgi:hypothetical protein
MASGCDRAKKCGVVRFIHIGLEWLTGGAADTTRGSNDPGQASIPDYALTRDRMAPVWDCESAMIQ